MRLIHETKPHGWEDLSYSERLYIYALENEEEYNEIFMMTHREKCDKFDLIDECGHDIPPGAYYRTYDFRFIGTYLIIVEIISLNV